MRQVGSLMGINVKVADRDGFAPLFESLGMTHRATDVGGHLWEWSRTSGFIHLFRPDSWVPDHLELEIADATYEEARDDVLGKGILSRGDEAFVPAGRYELAQREFGSHGAAVRSFEGHWASLAVDGTTPSGLGYELFYGVRRRTAADAPRLEEIAVRTPLREREAAFYERLGFPGGRAESGQQVVIETGPQAAYSRVVLTLGAEHREAAARLRADFRQEGLVVELRDGAARPPRAR